MLTQQWQGEWPGVGRQRERVVEREIVVDQQRLAGLDDRAAIVAPDRCRAGCRRARSPPPSAAYSRLWKMYFAFGKVGTQRPLRSIVFQPQWSMCRCVQNT